MATIASLVVSIGADIADLKKKVDDADRSLSAGISRMNSAVGALTATAAFAAVSDAIGQVADAADEIDGFAARINDTARAVQRLQAVAESGDAEIGAIVASIQKLQAGLGTGKIDGGLRAIGIEVDKFKALSPSEQYLAMAEALGRISDPTERAARAQEILGKNAAAVAGTFKEGIGDVDRWVTMSDETVSTMDRLGISFANAKASLVNFTGELLMNITQLRTFLRLWDDWIAKPTPPGIASPKGITNAALPSPADPFGKEMLAAEKDLTAKVNARIKSEEKAAESAAKLAEAQLSLTEQIQATTNQALTRGGMFGPMWGQNVPGVGPGTFPGWAGIAGAAAMAPGFMPGTAGVNGSGAWMLRTPVESALSGGGGPGGLSSFLQGRGGALLGGGLGMLTGLIPGLSGRGSSFGSTAGATLGMLVGGPLAPILGPLGGLAGGLIGKLFGGGEGRKVNDLRDDYTAKMGGTQKLAEMAQEAGTNLNAFFKADTVKEFEAAIGSLDKKFGEFTARTAEVEGMRSELALLTEQSKVGFDEMASIAKEFGLDIAKLGPAFQQQALDKDAQRIIDAFAKMEKGGADMNGVLDGMQDEISKVVSDSLKFGTVIPSNMKPWIEELSKTGRLVGENGTKIDDLSKLKFGDPLVSETDKLVKKMDELIEKIANALPNAIRNIPNGNFRITGEYNGPALPDVPQMATGGIVTRPTLALIGEAGPEAVIPLRGNRGMGGGMHVTVNVDASGSLFDGYTGEAALMRRFEEAFANTIEQQRRLAFAGV